MNKNTNPFTPGAGFTPEFFAGRETLLESLNVSLGRLKRGRPASSQVIVGLRGAGKSSVLNHVETCALEQNYIVGMLALRSGSDLKAALTPVLRAIVVQLKRQHPGAERVNEALRVTRSFIGNLVTSDGADLSLGVDPEPGFADSGDFTTDLKDLLAIIGAAAKEVATPVVIMLDEFHHSSKADLAAFLRAVHVQTQTLNPLLVIMAGMPQLLNQVEEALQYGERNMDVHRVEALSRPDLWAAINRPIQRQGAEITEGAIWAIEDFCKGYPYLLQAVAYHAWNIAAGGTITEADVIVGRSKAVAQLDDTYYRVQAEKVAPVEMTYLQSLADLPEGPQRSSDVAKGMKRGLASTAPIRDSLMKKGIIFSPEYGKVAFATPLFGDYVRRQLK